MNQEFTLKELKNVLYLKVSDYLEEKEMFENINFKLDILREIISYLNSSDDNLKDNFLSYDLQLSLIYSDSLKEKFSKIVFNYINSLSTNDLSQILENRKTLKTLFNSLNDEYEQIYNKSEILEGRLQKLLPKIKEYRKILSGYKYGGLINNNQIKLLEQVMNDEKVKSEDQVRIFEQTRIHNDTQKNQKTSYTVLKMLDEDIKLYDFTNLETFDFKNKVDSMIKFYLQMIKKSDDIKELYEIFPTLKDQNISYEEFDYTFKKILNELILLLHESKESISKKDIYNDIELRKVVIAEYNEIKQKYNKILYYFNTEILYYKTNNIVQEENYNNLFYAFPPNGRESYIEKDLKDIPEEYLEKVKKLLDKLKENNLNSSEITVFRNTNKRLKNFQELRDDQVRILFKRVFDNNYLIIGVGIKKTDNDLKMYFNLSNRNQEIDITDPLTYNRNLEISSMIEENIDSYIKNNSRKGIR